MDSETSDKDNGLLFLGREIHKTAVWALYHRIENNSGQLGLGHYAKLVIAADPAHIGIRVFTRYSWGENAVISTSPTWST